MQTHLASLEQAIKKEGTNRYLIKLTLLTILYILTALFGLSLSGTFDHITTIWLPTGIAITALMIWGYHYMPGVFVGALLANIFTGASPMVATGIATGNALEALIAALLIHRFIRGQILEKISGVIKFVVLACFLSTTISATVGTLSLSLDGIVDSHEFSSAWLAWWMGDMMGALLVVPFVLAWRDSRYRQYLADKLFDGIFIITIIATVCLIIFSQPASIAYITSPLIYLIFPLIMWASVRLIQIGAVTATMVVSIAAAWGTLAGTGPYTNGSTTDVNLAFLHIFILTIIITGLVLAVSVSGRLQAEAELRDKAKELEYAKQQIIHNVKWRKNLQHQMKNATDQINQILSGVFEERPKGPPK